MKPDDAGEGPWLEVDLDAISANWRTVGQVYSGGRVGAVVKHDAYGLDASRIGPWLARLGCRHFWVDTYDEGVRLQAALGDGGPFGVFVMHGLGARDPADFEAASLIPVVTDAAELARLRTQGRARSGPGCAMRIAVQLDIGLTRLGLNEAELRALTPQAWEGLEVVAWVGQLSRFDRPDDPVCLEQQQRFVRGTAAGPAAERSLACSAGVFGSPQGHFDHARVGSALYGVVAGPMVEGRLQTAVTLRARVLRVQRVPAGTGVGYGPGWTTPEARTLATLALGYGHGLLPAFAEGGHVVARGQRVPLRGGVAMGLCTADVSTLPEGQVRAGDWVEVYGAQQALHEVARAMSISPNALLVPTAKGARRTYAGGDSGGAAAQAGAREPSP